MSCREVVEIASDYLEGALEPDVRARLEAHLEPCEWCRTYVEQMRTTTRLAALTAPAERPDADALLAAFRAFRASG
jgi:predicted anti-sigma-YlaC factor YlaD